MSILLLLLFFFFVGWLIKSLMFDRPIAPKWDDTLTAAMKYDELTAHVHYQGWDSLKPQLQRIVSRWAIGLDNPDRATLHDALQREITAALPNSSVIVSNIVLPSAIRPPEPKHEKSRAQRMDEELVERVVCTKTLYRRLIWLQQNEPEVAKILLKGRSVEVKFQDLLKDEEKGIEDHVRTSLNALFHTDGDH